MMFVQVISGRVRDAAQLKNQLDRWMQDCAPGATGWLGTTSGVTDDGRFVALARFESEDDARRNSDRPEQDAWWQQATGLLDGEPDVHDSEWAFPDLVGDPGKAGFVQVMQGRGTDPDRAHELMQQNSGQWADFRPDILGSLVASYGNEYTMAIWFTSEDEAREGEKKEPPAELREQMAEMDRISDGEPAFLDLRDPWMYAPA